jgi:predicted nuclease of restriction endonuclease-like (RecB) superfamily
MKQSNSKNIKKIKMDSLNDDFYKQVFTVLKQARSYANRTINFAAVLANWHIGRLIVEEEQSGKTRAEYGKFLIKELSERLTKDFGKGYDLTNLKLFRKFYIEFPLWQVQNAKGDTISNLLPEFELLQKGDSACHQLQKTDEQEVNSYVLRIDLSWSHYRILMRVEKSDARQYYIYEAANEGWNVEQLKRQINSFYYERLLATNDKKAVKDEARRKLKPLETQPNEIFKDPSIFELLGLKQDRKYLEHEFEQAIIDNLQSFLLELGKGFAFIARQQHIRTETKNFYIDLVFYNYLLKCFVIIDLKTEELTHQDVGQLDMYVRMYDDLKRTETDNPTIGILLCADKDETVVKYSMLSENKQLFASKYMLYLPTKTELKAEIERNKRLINKGLEP